MKNSSCIAYQIHTIVAVFARFEKKKKFKLKEKKVKAGNWDGNAKEKKNGRKKHPDVSSIVCDRIKIDVYVKNGSRDEKTIFGLSFRSSYLIDFWDFYLRIWN